MDSRRRAIMGIVKSGGRLPNEYQEVEYLQSTGEQYIDTGVNISDSIEYQYLLTDCLSFAAAYVQWYLVDAQNYNTTLKQGSDLCFRINGDLFSRTVPLQNVMEIQYKNHKFYVDGVEIWTNLPTINDGTTSYFLAKPESSSGYRGFMGKAHYLKIYDNGIPIRKFIPCYRKADNKPGMYDLVNDVFYTNANTSASQDFIVGPDV